MTGDTVMKLAYENNARIAREAGGWAEPLGELTPGAWADVVLLDYRPYTPLTADNLPWQIIFGVDGAHVNTTIVGGQVLMRDHKLLTLDEERIAAQRVRVRAENLGAVCGVERRITPFSLLDCRPLNSDSLCGCPMQKGASPCHKIR